ncbi:folate receptor family protein [Anaeramoeba flamelloides]|uniref:Folate receptor family protein n=1 Tax=Anaeramoeba flamelloides TaxID=1746091 RepID=A0AAV7YTW7_9EUKA|nr:folate receptor family protein [Anaeramoeba flamelloides]
MSKYHQPLPNLPNTNQELKQNTEIEGTVEQNFDPNINTNNNNTTMNQNYYPNYIMEMNMNTNNNINMNMNTNMNMNMNMNTNTNMNMNMNLNNDIYMNNLNTSYQTESKQNKFSNKNNSPATSDFETEAFLKKRRRQRNRRKWFFPICFFIILIIILVIYLKDNVGGNQDMTDGQNHGTGSPGLTCPPSKYYLNKTDNNNLGCCNWYDYTCGKEYSDNDNDLGICSDKKNYNEILNNQTSQCNNYLGLISCGPLSPYVNYFAPDISVGSDHQKMEICDTFCDTVYQECKSATFDCSFWNSFPHQHCNEQVGDHYSDGKSFCKDAIFLEYSTDHDNCFAPAGIFKANIFLMMLTICFLTFFWN